MSDPDRMALGSPGFPVWYRPHPLCPPDVVSASLLFNLGGSHTWEKEVCLESPDT